MDGVILLKGFVLGFVIAAPAGPIGILCARRTLMHGWRAGFFSGMGAASADSVYGFIAAFGLTFISDFIEGHQTVIRLAGGVILCMIGIRTLRKDPGQERETPRTTRRHAEMYTSTLLLTLTNPMTIFSFAAVFAGFGLAGTRGSLPEAATLIAGVFVGSAAWWLFIIAIFSVFKARFRHGQLKTINTIAGIIITGTGVFALLSLVPFPGK
jgi:threonine/homoserine/homoserine lactone efflux protein